MNLTGFFHILNPSRRHRRRVEKIFRDQSPNLFCWVERTSHPTHLETIIQWALQENRSKLAIWGGDGTFSRSVQALFEREALSKVKLMLVPVGTCNDLAKQLNLNPWNNVTPSMLDGNCFEDRIDIGVLEANGKERVFVNNAGFGRTKEALSRKKSNPIQDIKDFRETTLNIDWETDALHQFETIRSFFGIVFNGGRFNCGMYFDKKISVFDGTLNGFFVPPQPFWPLFSRFAGSRFGRSLNGPEIVRIDGKVIRIDSDRDMFPQVDGEKVDGKGTRKIVFSALPKALTIYVPKIN